MASVAAVKVVAVEGRLIAHNEGIFVGITSSDRYLSTPMLTEE